MWGSWKLNFRGTGLSRRNFRRLQKFRLNSMGGRAYRRKERKLNRRNFGFL